MSEFEDEGAGPTAGGGGGDFVAQLPAILWHRRWLVIAPVIVATIGAVIALLILSPRYESAAVLLVQSPSLPAEVIGANSDDLIDRRIERIRQQVINRPELVRLIEEKQLYASERGRKSLSSLVQRMRDAIEFKALDADLGSSKPEERTIAFRLAFTDADPRKAQAVAQSLMEKIIELNSIGNIAASTQTVAFLQEQATSLQRQVAGVEGTLASLSSRYGGVLSRSGVPMINSNAGSYDLQIAELLRSNQTLTIQRETSQTSDRRDPIVAQAEAQLAAARAVYADSHPDVRLAQRRLEEAKALAARNVTKLPLQSIDEQIAFNNSQIAQLRAAKATDQAQVAAIAGAQSRAPAVQQQVVQLQQTLDGYNKQYQAVSERLMTAQAGARATDEQMGERLITVDPPVVPDEPAFPKRLLIMALAIGGGLAFGLVLALGIEMFLQPIRSPAKLAALTGRRTLALVPVIKSGTELTRERAGAMRRFGARLRLPGSRYAKAD